MEAQRVKFDFEKTNVSTELPTGEDVHQVFADLIKEAKQRIGHIVRVDISENYTKEKTGGTLLNPERTCYTTIELKLTVKVPDND